METNVQWVNLPNENMAKYFAIPYAQLAAKVHQARGKQVSATGTIGVPLPRQLAAKLGNTTTVAPQTDNVYTIGADMGPTAFKKGQDMLREEAGDPVVAELMEVLECMSGFGNNNDR